MVSLAEFSHRFEDYEARGIDSCCAAFSAAARLRTLQQVLPAEKARRSVT